MNSEFEFENLIFFFCGIMQPRENDQEKEEEEEKVTVVDGKAAKNMSRWDTQPMSMKAIEGTPRIGCLRNLARPQTFPKGAAQILWVSNLSTAGFFCEKTSTPPPLL